MYVRIGRRRCFPNLNVRVSFFDRWKNQLGLVGWVAHKRARERELIITSIIIIVIVSKMDLEKESRTELFIRIDHLEETLEEKDKIIKKKDMVIAEQRDCIAEYRRRNVVPVDVFDDLKQKFDLLTDEHEQLKTRHNLSKNEEKDLLRTISDMSADLERKTIDHETFQRLKADKNDLEDVKRLLVQQLADLGEAIKCRDETICQRDDYIKKLETEMKELTESIVSGKSISFNYSCDNSILDLNNLSMSFRGETVADMKIGSLELENEKLFKQNQDLEAKVAQLTDENAKLVEKIDYAEKSVLDLNASLEKLDQELAEKKCLLDEKSGTIEKLHHSIENLLEQQTKDATLISDLRKQLDDSQKTIFKLKTDVENMKSDNETLQTKYMDKINLMEQWRSELTETLAQVVRLERVQDEKNQIKENLDLSLKENAKLKAYNMQLQTEMRRFEHCLINDSEIRLEKLIDDAMGKILPTIMVSETKLADLSLKMAKIKKCFGLKQASINGLWQELQKSNENLFRMEDLYRKKCLELTQCKRLLDEELAMIKHEFHGLTENINHYVPQIGQDMAELGQKYNQTIVDYQRHLEGTVILAHFKHTLEIGLDEANGQNEKLKFELERLKETNEKLLIEMQLSNENVSKYQEQCETYRKEILQLQETIKKINNDKDNNGQEKNDDDDLKMKVELMEKKVATLRYECQKRDVRIRKLMEELQIESKSFSMERKTKERLLKENEELEKENRRIKTELAEHKKSTEMRTDSVKSGGVPVNNLIVKVDANVKLNDQRPTLSLPQGTGYKFEMADEEGQFMAPNSIEATRSQEPAATIPDHRLKQLIERNARLKPHLRSTYPVELQNIPVDENAMRSGKLSSSAMKKAVNAATADGDHDVPKPAKLFKISKENDADDSSSSSSSSSKGSTTGPGVTLKSLTPKIFKRVLNSKQKTWSPKHHPTRF